MSTTSRWSAVVAVLVAALVLGTAGVAQAALVLWLDSSDGATVLNTSSNPASGGDAIGTWQDKAGASHDAVAQTGNPIYDTVGGPNKGAVIDFSASSHDNLVTSGGTQARTITLVHRWDTTNVSPSTSSYFFDLRNGVSNSYVWAGGFGPNWTVYVDDSTTSTTSIGDVRNNTWQTTTFVGTSTGTDDMHIFSRYTNNEFGRGKVAEIRVYDTALTAFERQVVVSELRQKWFYKGPLVPIDTATASSTSVNNPTALIKDAMGNYYYAAPNPGSGGSGTSWYTSAAGSSNVWLVFDFEQTESVDELIVWDYYGHSPADWRLELFSGADATGTTLLSHDFSIVPGAGGTSTRHVVDLLDTHGVQSARLISLSNSANGGTGLGEVAFLRKVPEPGTFLLAGLGLPGLALLACRRRRRKPSRVAHRI